ncbi:hypothetical protein C8A05DRAFT_47179 [Staphylotrichum tortipilum]|uniref:DUF1279 domain-containing protein n=1 Tax=Staphylotrichum tortipilum TaxID=2831512 RepID=A0AAN6MD12_9PEZI|nr:hypothetical protein C8A05DRAFT_47179 [Staphylotrichum longicolle]
MLRTAFGAFDALGGSAVRGTVARDVIGKRIWAARMPAQAPAVPRHQRALMSQLAPARRTVAQPRFVQLRTPFLRPRRPFHSSRPHRSDAASKSGDAAPAESLSLSQRLKKLSREYGWTAVGIYLALSVLDFPFCFLLVRTVGTEKIAHLEDIVVSYAKKVIPEGAQTWWREYRQAAKDVKRERTGEEVEAQILVHGVEEADQRTKQEGASLATQLALAYAIHKSFIFIRVPLTAAITPKVVKVLRGWGWQIGKKVKQAKR